ncbi:unnamed protein product [Closterium sp. NIES-54]
MGAMAGAGGEALEGSYRHKEKTARLEDVFGAGAGAGGAGAGGAEPHSRTNLRRSESRGERMGAMAGAGGEALEGSFRHKERTARLEDVFGAGGGIPNDAVGAAAAGGARAAAGASAAAGGASRGGFYGAGTAGGGVSGGPVPLLPGNIKRKRTDRDNLDFTKGGSPARRTGEGVSAGATPTGARSSLAGGGEGGGGGAGGERKKGRWRQHRVGGGQRGAGGQAGTPPVATPPGHDSGALDPSAAAAAAAVGWEGAGDFDSKPLGSSPGDFFAPGSSLSHGIPLGKRSRGSGVGPGKSGKRKASADEFPDLDPNRNAMPTTPQPELEQVVELDNLAAGSVFGSAMPELGVQGDDFGGWLAGLPNDELLMGEDLGGLDGLAVPTDNLADLGF